MDRPELSVVLLCYREGERIAYVAQKLLELLRAAQIGHELVLVANYDADAPDATVNIAQQLSRSHPNIVALTQPKAHRQRFGWDVRMGLTRARGKSLLVLEADTHTPLESVITLFQQFRDGNYDVAKVARQQRYHDWIRWLLSHGYNALCQLLWPGLPDADINGKPKLFTREVYTQLDLRSNDWFIDTEIMLRVRRHGWRCLSLPVPWRANTYRPSHVTSETVIEFAANLLRWRFPFFPSHTSRIPRATAVDKSTRTPTR